MRGIWIAALAACGVAQGAEYLELVESQVYEAKGTAAEITKRASTCIAQVVRNDEVRFSDSSASADGIIPLPGVRSDGLVAAGPLVISVDMEAGVIVANSRVDYTVWGMIKRNAKSTLTFLAKDSRFKIRHQNIETLQKSTGSLGNDAYTKQGKWKGAGWEKAQAALEGVSTKLAQCVIAVPGGGEW